MPSPPRRRQVRSRLRHLHVESLESRQLLAVDWRNPVDSLDVNNDQQINAFDALAIINELNLNGIHPLLPPKPVDAPFLDVNATGDLTAFDAIAVINLLNLVEEFPTYQLLETPGSLLSQQTIDLTTGGSTTGNRLYRLKVQPAFDTSDTNSANEDELLISLVNPQTGQTLIHSGTPGGALFSLGGSHAKVHSGLVQWDGTFLTIDLSQFNATDTLELKLQLLNLDQDSGSRVRVTPWSNTLNMAGVPLTPGPARPAPALPGPLVDVAAYTAIPGLRLELANLAYQSSTSHFTAEARLFNDTLTTVRGGYFSLPNLAAGVSALNASGLKGGAPYWNFDHLIGGTGLLPQTATPWLKIELTAPADKHLNLAANAYGQSNCAELASLAVFCGTFSDIGEQYFYDLSVERNEDFLVLPIRTPAVSPATRLENAIGIQLSDFPTTLDGPLTPINPALTGAYQLELTARGTGDFAFAVHSLPTVEELQFGAARRGSFDARFGPHVYAFEGLAGQHVIIDNRLPPGTSRLGTWQLLADDGTVVSDASLPAGDYDLQLTQNGRHYLIFSPPDFTGERTDYDFVVRALDQVPHALTWDVPQTATIATFAQQHVYSFAGNLNQQIIIDSLQPGGDATRFTLLNPLGHEESFTQEQPFLIDREGVWQLIVRGDQPGAVSFRVLDVANLPSLDSGVTVTGSVSAAEPDFYRVPMIAGERFTLVPNNFNPFAINITGPATQPVSQEFQFSTPWPYAITDSGTGVVRIGRSGTSAEANPYSYTGTRFMASAIPHTGFEIEYQGDLNPGESFVTTFEASAGTPILIDRLLDPEVLFAARMYLRDPNGLEIYLDPASIGQDSNIITLTKSGTYQLVAEDRGVPSTLYGYRVLDLTSAPLFAMGDTITTTLTRFRSDVRRIDPEIGDRLFLETLQHTSAPAAVVRVYNDHASALAYESDRDDGQHEFRSTQRHYLLIEQETAEPTSVSIRTQLLQNAAPLTLGTPITTSLPAHSGKLYHFFAEQGQQLFIDLTTYNPAGNAGFRLVGETGSSILLPGMPYQREIQATGDYYLWVDSIASSPFDVSFVATLLTSQSTPMVLGAVQTAVLSSAGERRVFSFSGEEGDLRYFDGLDQTSPDTSVYLIDHTIGEMSYFGDTSDNVMYHVPRTGDYSLVIGDHVGTFEFQLVDPTLAPLMPLNTNVLGTIPASDQATIWRVQPPAGVLYVDSNATAAMRFESPLSLFRADGGPAGSTSLAVDNDFSTSVAPDAGDYYLVTSGDTIPFHYDLRLRTPGTTTVPITVGSVITGQIDQQREIDDYTFSATRGQRIHLDRVATFNIVPSLLLPDGATLSPAGDHSYLLPETGTYRVRMTGNYQQSYQFYLLDADAQPLLPLDTPIVGSTTQGDARLFRLPSVAGQRFQFDYQSLSGATANARWLLYSPQGTEVFDAAFVNGDQTVTLAETGDYLLALRAPSGAVDYSFQVNTIPQTPVTPSGLNQTYNGSIPANQVVNVTFSANAGQRIYLDVLERTSLQPAARLFGPGDVVIVSNVNSDQWLSLPVSGSYRLQLSSGSSATNYSFRLIDAAQASTITRNTPFTINFDEPHESLIWALEGTVGDRLLMELFQGSWSGSSSMLRPDGTSTNAGSAQHTPEIEPLTQSGRHYLVLKGGALAAPITSAGFLWDLLQSPTAAIGAPISGQFSPGTEYHMFGVDLTAGERIYITPISTSIPNTGSWHLFDPGNNEVFLAPSTKLSLPFAYTALRTGRYTLLLRSSAGDFPFDYTFQIHKPLVHHITSPPRDHGFGDD